MATEKTFWKPIGIKHDVTAAEASSGIVRILVPGTAPASGSPTDDFLFTTEIKTTANLVKTDFTQIYDVNSGTVYIEDGSDSLVAADKISVVGMYYT